jgi:hypothetical protein
MVEFSNSVHYDQFGGKNGMISMGYSMYVKIDCKQPEGAEAIHKIMHEWAPTMFKEEPNMYRKTVLGVSNRDAYSANVIMQWKSKADFSVHSDLPYMTPFKKAQMPYVATNFKDDLTVDHSPCWHIEKPGTAGFPCFTTVR